MAPYRRAPLLLAFVAPLLSIACSSSEDDETASTTAAATSSATGTGDAPDTTTAPAGTTSGGTGPDTTAATTHDTGPTTGEPTTDGPAGSSSDTGQGAACDLSGVFDCCCFDVAGEEGHGILSISCPDPGKLCEAPQATCPEGQTDCGADVLEISSVEGLECVLQALAAGTPGAVSWGIAAENGLNGSNYTLFIQEDGSVLATGYEYKELEYTYTAVERRARQADSYFTDCAAAATDVERFECLRLATTGEATETCIAGFSGTAGR